MACLQAVTVQGEGTGGYRCGPAGGGGLAAALERVQWGKDAALKRLSFSRTVHSLMKETWETTLANVVQDALESKATSAGREAVSEYSRAEVELRVLEKTKELHLLRIQLDTALDELELAAWQRQVLEARVADQQRIACDSDTARKRLKKKLQAARGEVQQERRARVTAESAFCRLETRLREEEAVRLTADKDAQRKVSEVDRAHRELAAQYKQLQQELRETKAAKASGPRGEVIEQQLKVAKEELQALHKDHAAGQKECARLKCIVAQQSNELEAFESEQTSLKETVQSLEAKLTEMEASHATLAAENGDLRMLCRDAGAQVPGKKAPRKSRESPTRNLGGAMEQAAPRQKGSKRATRKSSEDTKEAVAGTVKAAPLEERAKGTEAAAEGPGQEKEKQDGKRAPEASGAAEVERRFSPRLKRPSSAESRQSAAPACPAAPPAEREAKRARLEQRQGLPAIEEQGDARAARAPLQSLRSNSVGSPGSSRPEAAKPARSKRQLAPSASKVLGAPPARLQSKSLFGRAFSSGAFKVPRLLATKGQSSQDADRATLMSP